jgi:hypothetical protein
MKLYYFDTHYKPEVYNVNLIPFWLKELHILGVGYT